jgi:cytochrome c peroxidase
MPQKTGVKQAQLADEFMPLKLNDEEIDKLADFIENGLHDSNLNRFVPERVLSGQCFPNNDYLSKADLGCK